MDINNETTTEITEEVYREIVEDSSAQIPEYAPAYILAKMEEIRLDTAHIDRAMAALESFQVNECPNGGQGDAARANAILDIVKCRETTNQKILSMLERMYDDLTKPEQSQRDKRVMEFINNPTLPPSDRIALFEKYILNS